MAEKSDQAAGAEEAVQLRRSAKGKRPQYFLDPASDKLHSMLWAVIEELSVTRDRVDALERVLASQGVTSVEEVDAYAPDDVAVEQRAKRRGDYIRRVTKCFTDEIAQVKRADPAMDFEDVVKVIADES